MENTSFSSCDLLPSLIISIIIMRVEVTKVCLIHQHTALYIDMPGYCTPMFALRLSTAPDNNTDNITPVCLLKGYRTEQASHWQFPCQNELLKDCYEIMIGK